MRGRLLGRVRGRGGSERGETGVGSVRDPQVRLEFFTLRMCKTA